MTTTSEARRAIAAAYLAYLSAPEADYAAEYAAYSDALADLASGAYKPAGVVAAYMAEL